MTADDARGQLVATLREFWQSEAGKPLADLDITAEALDQNLADALLPVVSRIADQRAVEAVGAVATEVRALARRYGGRDVPVRTVRVAQGLRALAARLAPPTEPKEQQA